MAHTATLADLLAPEMEIDEGPTALWCWWEDTGRIRTLRIDRGALRSNAVAIESQRISPRRIVDGVLLPTTAADETHMQLIE